jgi:hypothetical protein
LSCLLNVPQNHPCEALQARAPGRLSVLEFTKHMTHTAFHEWVGLWMQRGRPEVDPELISTVETLRSTSYLMEELLHVSVPRA